MMASPLATIGIISIGEMGLGIAKLLVASGYRVTTNVTGRRHVIHQDSEH
jgi:3-hydroxyisobutyrate dehydrogenase-like beta-hydroxyacid dehydrogenase